MSFFSKISDRIFGRKAQASERAPAEPAKPAPVIFEGKESDPDVRPPAREPAPAPAPEPVDVEAGPHGSADQNIALHKAVMRKLAENGGKVPDELKD